MLTALNKTCNTPDLAISQELHQAYLQTHYQVFANPVFVLHIGKTSTELQACYHQHATHCCAFLTADNPRSQALSKADNHKRQQALYHDLLQHGWRFYAGEGKHPTSNWPAEASFFILGMSDQQASALARQYQQNAFVWAGENAIPELRYA